MRDNEMDNIAITILSALPSGLIGVLIGTVLNRRYEKRREQIEVLKCLVTYRWQPINPKRIEALNAIPILFYKEKEVCKLFESYQSIHDSVVQSIQNPIATMQKISELNDCYVKILEAMAKSLHFKSLSWDKLKNPYIPKSYQDSSGNLQWY